jgi:2-polyprenyl-6-methoxyphenol hydroxylase-like FAD-dependent oxidoreductase
MHTNTAVVIGGSVAGLLAACALSDHYAKVLVFERDTLPSTPEPRRGVPQGRQVHALLNRGGQALEALLPGFLEELVHSGVPTGDYQREHRMYLDGHLLAPGDSGLTLYCCSRPLVEHVIRRRVAALPQVTVIDGTGVTGLIVSGDGGRVVGVEVDGDYGALHADLVVDATGRGSSGVRWLRQAGLPVPDSTVIRSDVVYVTRHFARKPEQLDGLGATIVPYPGMLRGGVVIPQEGDSIAVVLAGMLGEEPPTDDAAYAAYAHSLPSTEVADVIEVAEPIDEPAKMRFRESVRHHFERLDPVPDGFLAVGDALCDFNPVYGQGMTVAAMEAEVLRDLLGDGLQDLSRRFFAAAADLLESPWEMAAGGDYRFPQVEGVRPPGSEEAEAYLDQYRVAASVDPVLGTRFLRVAHMVESPSALGSPDSVDRVRRATGAL